jgi:hypothetical protein
MTSAELHQPSSGAVPARGGRRARPRLARLRLVRLHLASRRVPTALAMLAACGVVLWAGLHWHWIRGSGPAAQHLPLAIEAGTAAVIAVTTASPLSELERATGRWLPCLRLAVCAALAGAAFGALAAGAAAEHLPGGNLDMLRNIAGLAGIGLLCAALLGGGLGWVGPMAYLVVAEYALDAAWTTPWMWPTRPPHDLGAALCAALVFAAGTAVITIRGARNSAREQ